MTPDGLTYEIIGTAMEVHSALGPGFLESRSSKLRQRIRSLASEMRELREAQKTTEEKLHALIDTVDRIVRNQKN